MAENLTDVSSVGDLRSGRKRRHHRYRRRPGRHLQDGKPQSPLLHRALSGRGDGCRRHHARRACQRSASAVPPRQSVVRDSGRPGRRRDRGCVEQRLVLGRCRDRRGGDGLPDPPRRPPLRLACPVTALAAGPRPLPQSFGSGSLCVPARSARLVARRTGEWSGESGSSCVPARSARLMARRTGEVDWRPRQESNLWPTA